MTRPKTPNTGIHMRLKEIRLKEGKCMHGMARLLGVAVNTYRRYEHGDYAPSPATMNIYVKTFDISLEWLLLGRGPKNFEDIPRALEQVKTLETEKEELTKETEQLQRQLESLKAEHESFNPAGSIVVTEKDMVELIRYSDANPLFKYQLLTYFFQYKGNPKLQHTPAAGISPPE